MKKITAVKTMSGEMKLMFSLDSEKSERVPTARQQKPTRNRNPLTSFKNIIYSPLVFIGLHLVSILAIFIHLLKLF